MQNTTTNQIGNGVDAYFSTALLSRPLPWFTYALFAQIRPLPGKSGQVARFRRYSSLTPATTALTEGVTPNGNVLAKTDVTVTPSQYGDYIILSDYLKGTSLENIVSETEDILVDQMGQTINQIARDALAASGSVQYAGPATSRVTVGAGMLMTADELSEATLTLKNNNAKEITTQIDPMDLYGTVPVPNSYILLAGPSTCRDLENDPLYDPVETYSQPSERLGPWERGRIRNVRIIETGSDTKIFTAGGASSIDVHCSILLGEGAYGMTEISELAMKMCHGAPGTLNDPLFQRESFGWKLAFAFVILNSSMYIRLEHAVGL